MACLNKDALSRKLGLEFEVNPYDLNPSPSQHTHESVSKVYDFHLVTGSGNKIVLARSLFHQLSGSIGTVFHQLAVINVVPARI